MGKVNREMDPMGRAIADYYESGMADRLRVFSPMFEEDKIPVPTLFRRYEEMPGCITYGETVDEAIDMARGKTLDVGAGAGCHSFVLQHRGIDVTAIDISPLSVETMRQRGVENVMQQDFFAMEGQYDTILMLMNGIGIVGTLERMPAFFHHLDRILAPGGQLLCDSTDISYVFEDEDGHIDYPGEMEYYGEIIYQMQYKDTIGHPFPWLYIDADTLRRKAGESGYAVEVVAKGEHDDFLARIMRICF